MVIGVSTMAKTGLPQRRVALVMEPGLEVAEFGSLPEQSGPVVHQSR